MTCMGMSGSGAVTSMGNILLVLLLILKDCHLVRPGLFAAAAGTSPPGSVGQPLAVSLHQGLDISTLAFALPGWSKFDFDEMWMEKNFS